MSQNILNVLALSLIATSINVKIEAGHGAL